MRALSAACLALVACALLPAGASAADFYASKTGASDANPCTSPAAPCKTIAGALARAKASAAAPHVIHLAAGTYTENPSISGDSRLDGLLLTGAGAASRPKITQSGGSAGVLTVGQPRVVVEGVEVEAKSGNAPAIVVSGAGSTLRGLRAVTRPGGSVAVVVGAAGVTIAGDDLEAQAAGDSALRQNEDSPGLAVADSAIRNTISPDVGVVRLGAGASVVRSRISAPAAGDGALVEVRSDLAPAAAVSLDSLLLTGGAYGVAVTEGSQPAQETVTVRNSTIDTLDPGVDDTVAGHDSVRIFVTKGGSPRVAVVNSLLFDAPGVIKAGDTGAPSIGCSFSDAPEPALTRGAGTNCAAGASGNTATAPGALTAGPGASGWDYHLRAGSPAIDSGAPGGLAPGQPATDLDGQGRIAAAGPGSCPAGRVDRGAFEVHGYACPAAVPARDRTAPRLRVSLLASRASASRGLRLRVSLSEAARLTGTISRPARGRRAGRRCSTRARRGRRCTTTVRVKSVRLRARSGRSTVSVSLRGLRPGRYSLALMATDAAGNRSRRATVRFTVVKPTAKRRKPRGHARRSRRPA